MSAIAWFTVLLTSAAGGICLWAKVWLGWIAIVQAILLSYAVVSRQNLLAQLIELSLLIALIAMGCAWPSIFTIAALVALPALVIGTINVVRSRSQTWASVYIRLASLMAASSMLAQAARLVEVLG